MRIGIVTATYLPSRNGVATSTSLYVKGLRALGHEVRVFAPRHPSQYKQASWVDEADIYRLPTSFKAAQFLGAPEDYPVLLPPHGQTLPLQGIEVWHTMHPFLAGRLALEWAGRNAAPVVYTAHTQYDEYLHYSPIPPNLAAPAMRRHVRRFAVKCDAVLAPGKAMEEMLRRYGFQGDVRIFPNPVDLSAFASAGGRPLDGQKFRAQYHLGEAPVVMYLGRLAPEKNLPMLLEAYAKARQSCPDMRLVLVGDGTSRPELERLLPEGAVMTGSLPYDQVPEALAAADVFATASTSEVLPMSMIEALAAASPLVAVQSPAALDLVKSGQNGLVTEPNAEALASGLVWALAPERVASLKAAALASAEQYDLRARALALVEIYEQTIAAKRVNRK